MQNEPDKIADKLVEQEDPDWLKDRELRSMRVMIEDAFQRNAELLDRVIRLEEKYESHRHEGAFVNTSKPLELKK